MNSDSSKIDNYFNKNNNIDTTVLIQLNISIHPSFANDYFNAQIQSGLTNLHSDVIFIKFGQELTELKLRLSMTKHVKSGIKPNVS